MVILIDHVESGLGISLLSNYTLKSIGYCDAAEVFVYLSGYLYGSVYSRVYQKHGPLVCFKKSARRGISLYFSTLMTLACCLAISVPFAFHNIQISKRLFLLPLFEMPTETAFYLLDLLYMPYGFGILRLYIIFFLVLIPALFVLLKWNALLAWLLSGNLYVLSQCFNWFTIPVALSEFRSFHFNPFSWQLLFFIGIVIGARKYCGKPSLFRFRFLKYVAILIILYAFYINVLQPLQVMNEGMNQFSKLGFITIVNHKQTLAPPRLINFLALAYFIGAITSSQGSFWRSKLAFPLVACGQHPLIVYSMGLVLMYLGVVLFNELSLGLEWVIPFHFIGCAISISVALVVNQYYKIKKQS